MHEIETCKYKLVEGSGGYPKKTGAMSNVATINGRYPTHQAPTQRGSSGSIVILQRKRSTQPNATDSSCYNL